MPRGWDIGFDFNCVVGIPPAVIVGSSRAGGVNTVILTITVVFVFLKVVSDVLRNSNSCRQYIVHETFFFVWKKRFFFFR